MILNKISSYFKNYFLNKDLYYVVEDKDWIIKKEGVYIVRHLSKMEIRSATTVISRGIDNSIIHFGSFNVFNPSRRKVNITNRSNKIIVSYFHVAPEDKRFDDIRDLDGYVDMWHTASNMTKDNLVSAGIPPEKIAVIPLGLDLELFKPYSDEEKSRIRKELGIPKNCIVIGSFQKDGVGWGEGLEPKLIKGPDIFCDVVKKLSSNYPVFVLLSGPSRGFVKNKLKEHKIPFSHSYVDYKKIPFLYAALDLYLVTSRVEGLPKSILECLACEVPFVTTRVGLVPDVVRDSENGMISESVDVEAIVNKSKLLIENRDLRDKILEGMRLSAPLYSWERIIRQYREKIYEKFL